MCVLYKKLDYSGVFWYTDGREIGLFLAYLYFREFTMIEAVNSVLSNASLSRGVAEQQSASRSYAANQKKRRKPRRFLTLVITFLLIQNIIKLFCK